jgi:hypothetical protein
MLLYKYLSEAKADELLLAHNAISLTPPIYLNDVTEFLLRRVAAQDDELRQLFDGFHAESASEATFEEWRTSVHLPEFIAREPNELRAGLNSHFGVVSLTSEPTNELMWAHYGLHSGIAIGYQVGEEAEVWGMNCVGTPLGPAIQIIYDDRFTALSKGFENVPRALCRKRQCWSYEKEWRIIGLLRDAVQLTTPMGVRQVVDCQRSQIAHVVLGINAKNSFAGRVRDWLLGSSAVVQSVGIDFTTMTLRLED